MGETQALIQQLWGSVLLRPYVFAFLAVYLVMATRDLGWRGTWALLGWGFAVAFVAEWFSTRVGVPFGTYAYTRATADLELFVSNVPLFSPLSFPFLAYASWCVARVTLPRVGQGWTVAASGVFMTLLDVVIDPLAVRGDRWFLGRIFEYPQGGIYFGVPLSNFGGWLAVGSVIVAGAAWWLRRERVGPGAPWGGVALYVGVLAFNLAITLWIGEPLLAGLGLLLHAGLFLLLWGAVVRERRPPSGMPEPRRRDRAAAGRRIARTRGLPET